MNSIPFIENSRNTQAITLNMYVYGISAIVSLASYLVVSPLVPSVNTQLVALRIGLYLALVSYLLAIVCWSNRTKAHEAFMQWAKQGYSLILGALLGWGLGSLLSDYSHQHLALAVTAYGLLVLEFYVILNLLFKVRVLHISETASANRIVALVCIGLMAVAGLDLIS